jgi:hypothetical protein
VSQVIEEGSCYRIEESALGTTLVATGAWNTDASAVLRTGRVDGLDLNYAKGFKDTDLAFIEDWPIKRLSLLARTVKDLSPLYRLAGTMESLSVESGPAELELGRFPRLVDLAANWDQIARTLSDVPQLESLHIGGYRADDLTPLRYNTGLTKVRMKDRPALKSLAGLEHHARLKHLGIYLATRLADFTALGDVQSLTDLHLESCRQLSDLTPIASNRQLAFLNVAECGDIPSLGPIAELDQLEVVWMYGSTRVVDDDLTPLATLPRLNELRIKSRKSYTPTVGQIQALIEARPSA